jgi:hypothetical protein
MSNWYPFEQFIELNQSIDALFGKGDGSMARVLGRHSADAHLTTIYRLFFKVGTVYWILGRGARLWGAYYDTGKLELYTRGVRNVEVRLVDFATPHRVHCDSVAGWVERSVELSGGKSVVVEHPECRLTGASQCVLRCSWV